MSYGGDPISLADKVRAVVACLGAAESSRDVFVRISYLGAPTPGSTPPIQRLWLKRIYAGEHKQIHGHATVLVGYDSATEPRALVARTSTGWHAFDVEARTTPFDGVSCPFEGAFDLKSLSMPAPR